MLALRAELVARLADSMRRIAPSAPQATSAGEELLGARGPEGGAVGEVADAPSPEVAEVGADIAALVAAGVDAIHVAGCAPHLLRLQALVDVEERRAMSGAPLTVARVLAHEEWGAGATQLHLTSLEEALRPGGQPRPVLMRAVAASAACGQGVLAELIPALLLCSTGLTNQLRLLPFAGADPGLRAQALIAWQGGDEEEFGALLLDECAQGARDRRMAMRRALVALRDDADKLAPLGRGGITARRALAVLRDDLATSMPRLSDLLGCSRPAAGDALERLVEVGLAVEITGRQRDRVYACAVPFHQLHRAGSNDLDLRRRKA